MTTIALLNPGDFVGEECLATVQPFHSATAAVLTDCVLLRIQKVEMLRVLSEQTAMSEHLVGYLLARTSRIQADLVDQLFNSTEKRLARTFLLLANFGKEDTPETLVPQISQETLAAMIGCRRSRVNFFLNRFRKLGWNDDPRCLRCLDVVRDDLVSYSDRTQRSNRIMPTTEESIRDDS